MKKIKIWFSGMDGQFKMDDNFIIRILRKHYIVELSENPDYLFYSVKSTDYLEYECVRIFFTAENLVPDFNLCDYAIGFHYIDFQDRYIRYPLYLVDGFIAYSNDNYGSDLQMALDKHKFIKELLNEKKDFCAFVYSNAEAAMCRQKIMEKLNVYKKVNSGGRYLNNIGGPVRDKLEFQKKHKFVIAFENTSTSGYTTEKIVHAFAAGAIPIYWGNPDIAKEFNENSFINCHKYGLTEKGEEGAIREIINRVKELDQKDECYKEMLACPAFIQPNYVSEHQKAFEQFLINIFSQKKEDAFRRNRYYWGERYERKQKIGNAFYYQCRKLIPVRDAIKKIGKITRERNK